MLGGRDRVENLLIIGLIVSTVILSVGMGLTIVSPKGIAAILAMLGGFLIFVFTVSLVFFWLIKELR